MHIPVATYRLQFHRGFRLADAQHLTPYLHRLGITDLYASPLFRARSGSTHGYDVTDPSRWNPELGQPEALASLCDELHRHQMSLLLDIVPNHMAASVQNPWWRNLLESGVDSPFAGWFDIDWHSEGHGPRNRIVLPVLECALGRVLQRGELALTLGEYGFLLRYHDQAFPVALHSCARLLMEYRDELSRYLDPGHEAWSDLNAIQQHLQHSGRRHSARAGSFANAESQRAEVGMIHQTIWRLYDQYEPVRRWLDGIVARFNESRSQPGRQQMERLLAEQPYRLVWWRAAGREINYRRFFAISDLVSLKMDQLTVFNAWHGLVKESIEAGRIQGLRVDHVDGLKDPEQYLQRLRQFAGPRDSFYLVVEKILTGEEALPRDWPVQGTTGYDFLNLVNRLLVDEEGYQRLRQNYRQFVRRRLHFHDVVYGKKRQAMTSFFGGELNGLARRVKALARLQQSDPGLSTHDAVTAFGQITACLTVYRTYIRHDQVDSADREAIDRAAAQAKRRAPEVEAAAWSWVRALLQMSPAAGIPARRHDEWLALVQRWQQYTGPIMAKGQEDAALYVYVPLASLNEVGGDPSGRPVTVEHFHHAMSRRLQTWPHSMSASSTHDTKRSEDVRARLNVLSEIPSEWRICTERWSAWNRHRRSLVQGRPVPDRNTEYLFYQSLAGALPMEWVRRFPAASELTELRGRIHDYMLKAVREATVRTRWIEPNLAYESALSRFVDAVFAEAPRDLFFSDLLRLHRLIAPVGAINSLSQLLLKLTAPGVPDFYQGSELWDLHLVDPDNRLPVDFECRRALLAEMGHNDSARKQMAPWLLHWPDGAIKLFVTRIGLQFRRQHAPLFASGDYLPLQAEGELAGHVCAFARYYRGEWSVTAAPLRVARWTLGQSALTSISWGDTRLLLPDGAPTQWRDVWVDRNVDASSGRLMLADLFGEMPVGLVSGSSSVDGV